MGTVKKSEITFICLAPGPRPGKHHWTNSPQSFLAFHLSCHLRLREKIPFCSALNWNLFPAISVEEKQKRTSIRLRVMFLRFPTWRYYQPHSQERISDVMACNFVLARTFLHCRAFQFYFHFLVSTHFLLISSSRVESSRNRSSSEV